MSLCSSPKYIYIYFFFLKIYFSYSVTKFLTGFVMINLPEVWPQTHIQKLQRQLQKLQKECVIEITERLTERLQRVCYRNDKVSVLKTLLRVCYKNYKTACYRNDKECVFQVHPPRPWCGCSRAVWWTPTAQWRRTGPSTVWRCLPPGKTSPSPSSVVPPTMMSPIPSLLPTPGMSRVSCDNPCQLCLL